MKYKLLFILIQSIIFVSSYSQDANQFRGANRDGIYDESNLLQEWPEGGPKLLWSTDSLGKGYSSAVVANGKVYVTGLKDTLDYLSALDINGNILWQVECGTGWMKSFSDTRSTPTVDNGNVYVISGNGVVTCVDANTGVKTWSVNGFDKFEAKVGRWGVAESPLVVGDKVIYTPGGLKTTMVALNKHTGETVWTSKSLMDTTAYVSPILVNYAGKKMLVSITSKYIFGVDANDGNILWSFRYYDLQRPDWNPVAPVINCNMAYYEDGLLYFTSGYNHVGGKLKLNENGTGVELLWSDTTLDVHHGHYVKYGNYIYGSNWISNAKGDWCCINWETGKTMYAQEWENKGSIVYADNRLYCFDEKRGNLALVEPTPDKFNIISSFKITQGRGPYWAHPSIEDGVLYIRHGTVLMAYNVNDEKSSK